MENTMNRTLRTLSLATLLTLSFHAGSTEPANAQKRDLGVLPMNVVAEVELEHGKVSFVDETVEGIFGFGILEQGKVNLAPFYEQGASALEIYLALAGSDAEVHPSLYRAHEMARDLDPSVPSEPRNLSAGWWALQKSVSYYGFDQDTSNCWGWGGVASYNSNVGNEPGTFGGHDSSDAHDEFVIWTTIPGGTFNTSNATYFDEDAELSDQFYATPYGHERAVSMCVTHAIVAPGESARDCRLRTSPYYNDVDYRVRLRGQQGNSTWVSQSEYLEAYGEGVRYRSSSSAARKYTLEVVDISEKSIICKEQYEVFLRSRWSPPLSP